MRLFLYFVLLVCFLVPETNAQNLTPKEKIIDAYRQDIKEIFDQKIRIKFKNNILGTGSESENDSYFFPPDKLVDEKYEALCYYSGTDGSSAIFIHQNRIYYRTRRIPFPHYRITKECEIENLKNEGLHLIYNAIEYPALDEEEKTDYIKNGFNYFKKANETIKTKDEYITIEANVSLNLKTKIISAFKKMKYLTNSSNEWKSYENIFSFFSMKPPIKDGCEYIDYIKERNLIHNLTVDLVCKRDAAEDKKNTTKSNLYHEIIRRIDEKGTVYQLGYDDSFFGFCLPSCYYPQNSLPYIVNNTMDALRSYMETPSSNPTENTLVQELDNLHTALENHKSSEWEHPVPEVNIELFTSIENELKNYALAFPNRPLRSANMFSDDDMPRALPKTYELLCHSHSSGKFSRIFLINGISVIFGELDTRKWENSKEAKEELKQLFNKLFIEQIAEIDSEKLNYANIANDLHQSKTFLNRAKYSLWNRSQITLSPKTISAIKETWKSLKELTCTSPNYCEFYYFSEYYPTFFDEESPQSYFQECLQKKAPTSPLIDPEDHTFSLLGYEDSYFGASPPSVFYKCDEIPYLLNDVISDIFELKNDSSLPKQEAVIEKLNDLQEAIQKSFPKKVPLTKPS